MQNKLRKELHKKIFKFDTKEFKFKEILENLYGCKLEYLHKYLGTFNEFERKNDQKTIIHKIFYSNFYRCIYPLYFEFQKTIISKIVNEPFYFQKIPTFRLGLPGNKFIGEFHKDTKYNHEKYEINFNLGLTGYFGSASLKVETFADSGVFDKMECPYGSIFSFDHIDCLHGCDINQNDLTMTSFDFRIALSSLYFDTNNYAVNTKVEFKPGSYFSNELISNT